MSGLSTSTFITTKKEVVYYEFLQLICYLHSFLRGKINLECIHNNYIDVGVNNLDIDYSLLPNRLPFVHGWVLLFCLYRCSSIRPFKCFITFIKFWKVIINMKLEYCSSWSSLVTLAIFNIAPIPKVLKGVSK